MSTTKFYATQYIRQSVSDDRQGESESIGNQRKFIDEYLKNHPEIEVISEKVDDGWSGILFDRPAFNEMMQDIQDGKVNCIITKDLSRFGREFTETGRYLRRILPAYGVRFIAINDNIDTLNDSGDDLNVSLKSLMNDEYCRDISQKTRSALRTKRANGEYIGACPIYGYRKSDNDHNQLVIDEYPARVVRDIFKMKLEGFSALRIADTLNAQSILSPIEYKLDRGLPHPRGGYADREGARWSATTIIRMLKDETYTGTLVQGKCGTPNYKLKERIQKPREKWYRTDNAHEAIIQPKDFDLVQKILRLDTRTSPKCDRVFLFSGVLICGCCGNRMTRKTVSHKGKSYYYYYCTTGKKNGCKASGAIKEAELTACVLESIRSHIAHVASLEVVLATLDADHVGRKMVEELEEQQAENSRRLAKINRYKAGLFEKMSDGLLTKEELKSLNDQYSEDIDTLNSANEKLRQKIEDVLSCKHERMAWTEHFTQYANLESLDRRTVIHLVHSVKIFSKTEIEITFNYQLEYDKALALLEREVA